MINTPVKKISVLLVGLMFVFSTLLQFHHHDRMGNIFITLSFIGEVELGMHTHHDCSCHHHNHGTEPGDCGDDTDCSMHLDIPLSTDAEDLSGHFIPSAICLDLFIEPSLTASCTAIVISDKYGRYDNIIPLPLSPDVRSVTRRGPPVLA